jgi:hypothetical protein
MGEFDFLTPENRTFLSILFINLFKQKEQEEVKIIKKNISLVVL